MPDLARDTANRRAISRTILSVGVAGSVLVGGCTLTAPTATSGERITERIVSDPVDTEKIRSLEAQLADKDSKISKINSEKQGLETQLKGMAPGTVVQVGTYSAASSSAQPSGWETAAALSAGATLLWEDAETFKTAVAQWDSSKSDLVYFTSLGTGYAGYTSSSYRSAGVQLIDGRTRTSLAAYSFDLSSVATESPIYTSQMATPHGLGVSPDGTQIYIPTGDGSQPWASKPGKARVLVVDARTGVLRQVIGLPTGPHHIKAFRDYQGKDRVIVELNGQGVILLDPADGNRVVKHISNADIKGGHYQVYASPDGKYLWLNSRSGLGHAYDASANVKWDLSTDSRVWIHAGKSPNGIAFSANGALTYMVDSVGVQLLKVDNSTNQVVNETSAAVPGPYNVQLNWDNTLAFLCGKGESSFNLGGNVGVIDLKTYKAIQEVPTGGQTIDHIILSPVRQNNEFWISSSGTHETIVLGAAKPWSVKDRIPTPSSGDTHSGAFVLYTDPAGYKGELQADQGGIHGSMLSQMKAEATAAGMK